ncbi:MAG: hypothetical protein RBR06_08630 [Desulfuromonadaceae bacterium]|nr:hypothetical protein [Desulfuromonadaceae bacterium]
MNDKQKEKTAWTGNSPRRRAPDRSGEPKVTTTTKKEPLRSYSVRMPESLRQRIQKIVDSPTPYRSYNSFVLSAIEDLLEWEEKGLQELESVREEQVRQRRGK